MVVVRYYRLRADNIKPFTALLFPLYSASGGWAMLRGDNDNRFSVLPHYHTDVAMLSEDQIPS